VAVLLDTDDVAVDDRSEVFRTSMAEASGSTRVDLEPMPEGVSGRLELWSFGTSRIFAARSTGVALVRDEQSARGASPDAVAIAVHQGGVGRHESAAGQRLVRSGDLMVVDVTRSFDFSWSGRGASTALQVPVAQLGIPLTAVQRAATRLESSPLYRLVSRHLADMTRDADTLSVSPGAAALGEASVHLVRALIVGAAGVDGAVSRDVTEETLLSQIDAYVRQHLSDPALGPESVAAELAVSRRQLFRICRRAEFSLEQHVINRRLEAAKAELASPVGRTRSIAAVAQRWGFKDATHFSRRFKIAYGLLPRDWRSLAHDEAAARG
jgi:AraC-like DNA-binding protein